MKIKSVVKSAASYPKATAINSIIFTAVAVLSVTGCSSHKLAPHKAITQIPEVKDKNNTKPIEPVEPAIAGMEPICKLPKK